MSVSKSPAPGSSACGPSTSPARDITHRPVMPPPHTQHCWRATRPWRCTTWSRHTDRHVPPSIHKPGLDSKMAPRRACSCIPDPCPGFNAFGPWPLEHTSRILQFNARSSVGRTTSIVPHGPGRLALHPRNATLSVLEERQGRISPRVFWWGVPPPRAGQVSTLQLDVDEGPGRLRPHLRVGARHARGEARVLHQTPGQVSPRLRSGKVQAPSRLARLPPPPHNAPARARASERAQQSASGAVADGLTKTCRFCRSRDRKQPVREPPSQSVPCMSCITDHDLQLYRTSQTISNGQEGMPNEANVELQNDIRGNLEHGIIATGAQIQLRNKEFAETFPRIPGSVYGGSLHIQVTKILIKKNSTHPSLTPLLVFQKQSLAAN